jgi:CRP-like cAMP-binding protein
MTELEQYIKSYFGVPQQDLAAIVSRFHPTTLVKNHFLLKTDHTCDQLCFVKSGLIRIYVTTEDREVTQWISTKGYFVTDLASFIFQTPARWNIQALTDCELYTINRKEYVSMGEVIPQWHHLEKLFIAKCFVILENRVFSFLSMTAEERYHMLFEQ